MEPSSANGILNLNKPRGMSSRELVNRVARTFRGLKVGHAGTLDPLASGVLVVPVGAASRLVPYLHLYSKTYSAQFELGVSSPSADLETPLERERAPKRPTKSELEIAAQRLTGLIEQVPPAHSAVKIMGVRAYEAARAGLEVVIQPRKVWIERLQIIAYEYPRLSAEITCSTGTYIRSLGCDWASLVGTTAVMTDLVRTSVGPYHLTDAMKWDEQMSSLTLTSVIPRLRPMEEAVGLLPKMQLTDEELTEIRHGRPIRHGQSPPPSHNPNQAGLPAEIVEPAQTLAGQWAAVDQLGRLHAILVERSGAYGPKRVFPQ